MFKVVNNNGFNDLRYFGSTMDKNSKVYILTGPLKSAPTQTSIQVGPDQHVEDKLGQYINHHCDPSVKVVGNELWTLKQLHNGDSVTFDYNATEDSMSNPFTCHCCAKHIAGKLK